MNRKIVATLSVLALAGGVGWQVASQPESSTGLDDVSLNPSSEHSQPAETEALARVRIRISPNDPSVATTDREVPQIALTAE